MTVNDPVAAVTSSVAGVVSSSLLSSRVVAIVLGLIFIAGSILVFLGEDIADALGVGSKGAIVKTVLGS